MNKHLNNYIEIVIPCNLMADAALVQCIKDSTENFGGCTMTEGRGIYVRKDDNTMQYESVFTVRFDFDDDKLIGEVRNIVNRMHELGEESVLRRRYFTDTFTDPSAAGYRSELIFRPTVH